MEVAELSPCWQSITEIAPNDWSGDQQFVGKGLPKMEGVVSGMAIAGFG